MSDNARIAAVFEEFADLLEIQGANPFRVRAYRNAARTVSSLGRELRDLLAEGHDLTRLAGIGKDLAEKIEEIVATGRCQALEALHNEVPAGLEKMLDIPSLGPKRVKALYQQLGLADLEALKAAAETGRLRQLPGFGAKTEQAILTAIAAQRTEERRLLLSEARRQAEPLCEYLRSGRGVREVVVAGSYRRGRETVGDLDILVTATAHSDLMAHFTAYPEVESVQSAGATRATVLLRGGLQVDLRLVPAAAFGAALHYFTGSKAHNIRVRRLGQRRGLKINEYGVFRGERRVAGKTEASVYKTVGLDWVEPELREDRGEIEAAADGSLPHLLRLEDLRGDLHLHTVASDGRSDIAAMAVAARAFGLRYIAVTEHSRSQRQAGGLDVRRLRRQLAQIDELNAGLRGITVLKGCEVDILEDGGLDLPDAVLRDLDLVIGAVHQRFDLPRQRQTERILRAMDHPCFTILAHPGGRLLLEREAMDVDMERVIRHAGQRGCFLELDSQPKRLDLEDVYCRMARDQGVLVAVNSDAHGSDEFEQLRYGVQQARRGWLEKRHVLNTRPLNEVRKLLRGVRG